MPRPARQVGKQHRDAGSRECGQGRGSVLQREACDRISGEGVSIQRLGWPFFKEWMSKQLSQGGLIDLSACRRAPIAVHRLPGVREHQIVEQRVAGTGVAGDRVMAIVHIGDIGHATDVQECDWPGNGSRLDQGAVIDRNDGRPLAAAGHIGRPEVMHHTNSQPVGERLPVADLDGQPVVRPVQDRLPMESHDVDRLGLEPVLGQKALDGLGVTVGHHALAGGELRRSGVAIAQANGLVERGAQQAPVGDTIGAKQRRALPHEGVTVRFDEGHIDPVHRSSRHEADGREVGHERFRLPPRP